MSGRVLHWLGHLSSRRERLLLASLSFLLTFGVVRLITHAIEDNRGPFANLTAGGTHIHHLVWGILGLLLVGYLWLAELGTGRDWASRLTAALFGLAAALTLDEFALWLNLTDVYFLPKGRESVDAVFIFAGLLSLGWAGGPLVGVIAREWKQLRGR